MPFFPCRFIATFRARVVIFQPASDVFPTEDMQAAQGFGIAIATGSDRIEADAALLGRCLALASLFVHRSNIVHCIIVHCTVVQRISRIVSNTTARLLRRLLTALARLADGARLLLFFFVFLQSGSIPSVQPFLQSGSVLSMLPFSQFSSEVSVQSCLRLSTENWVSQQAVTKLTHLLISAKDLAQIEKACNPRIGLRRIGGRMGSCCRCTQAICTLTVFLGAGIRRSLPATELHGRRVIWYSACCGEAARDRERCRCNAPTVERSHCGVSG